MKLVITGAGGGLGRALTQRAAAHGAAVLGVGRSPAPAREWAGRAWRRWDLREPMPAEGWTTWDGACVVHLAGDTAIREIGAPQIADAALLARRAAQLARRLGGSLILASSAAVYSGPKTDYPLEALREDDPTEPRTAYGMAKLAAEEAAREALPSVCVLRLFSVLGGETSPRRGHLADAILRALREGAAVPLVLDAQGRPAVRDYVTPDQFAEVVLQIAEVRSGCAPDGAGEVINVGSGVPTTTREVVELAAAAAGRPIPWQSVEKANGESAVLVADVSRLRDRFGGAPASRVADALASWLRRTVAEVAEDVPRQRRQSSVIR